MISLVSISRPAPHSSTSRRWVVRGERDGRRIVTAYGTWRTLSDASLVIRGMLYLGLDWHAVSRRGVRWFVKGRLR